MYTVGLCVDSAYALPALVTLGSLATATRPRERAHVDVCLLTTGIGRAWVSILGDVVQRLGFGSCSLWQVGPMPALPLVHGDYITSATYLRLGFPAPLLRSPLFLYLDADMLVLDDPASAFDLIDKTRSVGLVPDEMHPTVGLSRGLPGFGDEFPEHRDNPYFNAGAFWTDTRSLGRLSAGALGALRTGRRYIHFNDQDALNLWLIREGSWTVLPSRFNRLELHRSHESSDWLRRKVGPPRGIGDAATLHFVGPEKPWFARCPQVEAVRVYRTYLRATEGLLQRLGATSLSAPTSA
jgi:lipopolysaccharide biosynthesis glycosyltransferase